MKASIWFRSIPAATCALALGMPLAWAQNGGQIDPKQEIKASAPAILPTAPPQQAPVPVEILEKWAKDLDSDNFDTRQEATRKLSSAGKQAIPTAVKAAEGENLEVISRAIDVLKKLHQSEDMATKEAAQKALEGLTKSANKSTARKAGAALEPEKPAVDPNAPNNGGVIIGGFGGNIQLVPGARVARMQVQNNNGNKSIEIEEDGKKVKITEDKEGIAVTVTEKVDGKEKTSTYKAKTAEELKKNHPEGHKLWEKYAKNGNGAAVGQIQIQVQGGNAIPIPIQIQARPFRQADPADRKAFKTIREAQQEIEEASRDLRKQAEAGKIDTQSIEKAIGRIEAASKKIAEASKRAVEEKATDNADDE